MQIYGSVGARGTIHFNNKLIVFFRFSVIGSLERYGGKNKIIGPIFKGA
jgi:hypothetical protein